MNDTELEAQYASEIEEATKAFPDAAQLEGVDLQPYTTDRAWAAQAMGLKYGFVDDAGVAEYERTAIYPGALRDMGIVLWLRSLNGKTADSEIDKAARNPVAGAKKAAEWAQQIGIDDTRSEKFSTAYNIFMDTMNEVEATRTTPKN